MLEKNIESWIGKKVKALGGMDLKFVSPGNAGVPDRIYILPGVIWFVELKQDGGRLSAVQRLQRKRLQNCGCNYRAIKGMDEAKKFVEELQCSIEHMDIRNIRPTK